ncbi:FAD-binding oxidoreductase [Pseudoruegeria sp. SHC-113]|uniref:FAD-binding oxidoreductase n=1 Tax=Pseudoruegeria sp. SHC-113 TaxID=2855439 RepID=UPI0021BA5179|nr:FAD-linked oxidase C-terminal domain-containing protein [Pseudoruegeria sp. SHC-113]MCT8161022.1 FAD-binding protein [Pseudoruegeria sp. SHC-113]
MTIEAAISELFPLLGDRLSRSKGDLAQHGRSETHFNNMLPDAVAYPENTGEVSKILAVCHAQGCPVVAWGTGTSLEGHALALRGGISLDLSRMNRVLAVHPEDMDAVVQPGVTREALNAELRATGLFFSVDPGANASLGGMAATRASGTTSVRYGTMRDNVIGLEVVLADGRVIRTGTRARKSSAGYDLTGLFVGSEGTLGIITELTLRLRGQPEAISSAICAFESVEAAVETVIATIQSGISMARIEFVDSATARAFNLYAGREMPEKPHLLVEFHGSPASVAEDAERLGELVAEFGGSDFAWSSKPEERNALWALRHNAYYACLGLRKGATALVTDVCVPISRLAEAVEATRADIAESPLEGPILGHVGDGNFHAVLLVEPGNATELEEALRLSARMTERALEMEGTVTGEHGVGVGKLAYMPREHGEAWGVMGDIKAALDPTNILNPGKLVQRN